MGATHRQGVVPLPVEFWLNKGGSFRICTDQWSSDIMGNTNNNIQNLRVRICDEMRKDIGDWVLHTHTLHY